MIVADTSFILAYLHLNDSQHNKAIFDMAKIQQDYEDRFQISNLVILELLTLHNTRLKRKTFLHCFCSAIADGNSTNMFLKIQTEKEFNAITRLILKDNGSNLSFVDLSLIQDVKKLKSGKLLTYDKALYKYAKSEKIALYESATP